MDSITYEVRAYSDGSKYWYLNNERHREDGPAIEDTDGYKEWYLNGKLHREDGPAYEGLYGSKEWYLNGVKYTEVEFNRKMSPVVEMTMSEIEELIGKKVKVVK